MTTYIPCTIDEIPAGLRWDVPRRNQGQIIEVAYAAAARYSSEADHGDEYQRTTDQSDGSVTYARREDVEPIRWVALDRTRSDLVDFPDRSAAERYSQAWHRTDAVMQFRGGRYLDAEGGVWSRAQSIAALREAVQS